MCWGHGHQSLIRCFSHLERVLQRICYFGWWLSRSHWVLFVLGVRPRFETKLGQRIFLWCLWFNSKMHGEDMPWKVWQKIQLCKTKTDEKLCYISQCSRVNLHGSNLMDDLAAILVLWDPFQKGAALQSYSGFWFDALVVSQSSHSCLDHKVRVVY